MTASKVISYKELLKQMENKYQEIGGTSERSYLSCGAHAYVLICGNYTAKWFWRDKKTHFHVMDDFNKLTLAEARARATLAYNQEYDIENKKKIPSFSVYAKKYLETKISLARFPQEKSNVMKLEPLFKLPLNQLSNAEIKKFLLSHDFPPYTRRLLLRIIINILDMAAEDDFITNQNYAALLKSADFPAPKVTGFSWLPLEKLDSVFLQMQSLPELHQVYCLMLLYLCLRPKECRSLKLSYFDLKDRVLVIPRSEMKMKDESRGDFKIPLSLQAICLYHRAVNLRPSANSEFLFSTSTGNILSPNVLNSALRYCCGGQITLHGFRKTARTWMAENGVDLEVAMACLDHKMRTGADALYQRSDLFKRRIPVMQRYADAITAVLPAAMKSLVL